MVKRQRCAIDCEDPSEFSRAAPRRRALSQSSDSGPLASVLSMGHYHGKKKSASALDDFDQKISEVNTYFLNNNKIMKTPDQWNIEGNVLTRTFEFNNFVEAVNFVNKIVPVAEAANHHPDVEIFAYKKLKIKLSTHDAGDVVTEKDTALAEQINKL